MSFADLKRKSQNSFEFLQKELEKTVSTGGGADERFWKPELDASGNGYAVIRFLPAPKGESIPWAKLYSHAFQGPGGWYIENSLTTTGGKDPVGEVNRKLWNSGSDEDKEVARKQKRKLAYYSNIYVVKDPKNPENNGKVFLYKYGKKIFDKIQAAMQPEFQDETPVNVFDLWEGANFKLKIKTVAGYWNYDSSEFAKPDPLLDDDDALEAIWKKQYSLAELVAADQFKSYDELKKRLDYTLGVRGTPKNQDPEVVAEEEEWEAERRGEPTPKRSTPSFEISKPASRVEEDDEDADDALSYFQKLAES